MTIMKIFMRIVVIINIFMFWFTIPFLCLMVNVCCYKEGNFFDSCIYATKEYFTVLKECWYLK